MTKKNNTSKTTKKDVIYTPAPDPQWIALNQELTIENARLLERIDEIKADRDYFLDGFNKVQEVLIVIQSKWWYKLFRNL